MRLGLLVEIIDNPHLMQMQAVLTKPEDLVIGMSISGETEAVLDALRTAGLHHTETVLITACRKQHFQEQFGQILTVPAVEGLSLGDNISPQLPFLIICLLYTSDRSRAFEKSGGAELRPLFLVRRSMAGQ